MLMVVPVGNERLGASCFRSAHDRKRKREVSDDSGYNKALHAED